MKYLLLLAPIVAAMAVSCDETIDVGLFDESAYDAVGVNQVYLRDVKTSSTSAVAEFYLEETSSAVSVQANLKKASPTAVSGTVSIDADWLEVYNKQNGTKYDLLPQARVTIADAGAFTIAAGSLHSPEISVSLAAPAAVDASNTTYALPLVISLSGSASDVAVGEADNHVVYLVRDQRSLPDCIKLDAQGNRLPQSIVMYDGGHNPLSALTFELENGKLLWDIVVPFSSNLEWDQAACRPYLAHNPELQWAFDNREQVIEPLQRRGIKVILSILNGNGSIAGVAQLSELGAKTFAAEVARFVYANDLDGVFLDDEYAASPLPVYPYLASGRSAFNCARLYHELKKLMPDKLMCSYEYSSTATYGMQNAYSSVADVSKYIDIVIADYGGLGNPIGDIQKNQCTGVSIELNPNINRGGNLSTAVGERIMGGYGYWMAFNPHPPHYYNVITDGMGFTTGTASAGYSGRGQLDARMPDNGGIMAMYGANLKQPTVFYNKMDITPYRFPQDISQYK
jgi:hypothetical protein